MTGTTPQRGGARHASELGAATPLTLMLGIVLVIMPVMILILTVPVWEQRSVDAQDAARAAVTALVVASSEASGVVAGQQAANQVFQGDGIPTREVRVAFTGQDVPGGSVTASVGVVIPVGQLPGLGTIGDLYYTARSTEHVGSYEDSPT